MLSTPMYHGSGAGNQLHNYVTVKCLALDKGLDFGVMFPERFKGHSFMKLDFGVKVPDADIPVEGQPPRSLPEPLQGYYREEMIGNGEYDHNLENVADNTLIHGNLQGEDYYKHRREEIKDWLKVESLDMERNLCVINFRGGEYKWVTDFFLPRSYWGEAIELMIKERPDMQFEVHTDDPDEARKFFLDFPIIHNIGLNWRSIRYARYIILSNSSFGFLPAWLNDDAYVIAPKFWGRRNRGYWFLAQNYTDRFKYI
jgi:hypothetical protein